MNRGGSGPADLSLRSSQAAVRPLIWNQYGGIQGASDHWRAVTVVGSYWVSKSSRSGAITAHFRVAGGRFDMDGTFESVEDAKQCLEDYHRKMLGEVICLADRSASEDRTESEAHHD